MSEMVSDAIIKNARRVLVIDDDDDFLESLHLRLVLDGYDVLALASGIDAVQHYREFKPDIVLLDVKMPNISGYDVFLSLKNNDINANIFFTSGYALTDEELSIIKTRSPYGIIPKPISENDLKMALKTLDDR